MSLRVLIADDNRDAAESLGVLLNLGGDEVLVVGDGSAAVQAARDWRPDLAVLTESEIWPNLILQSSARGIPLALVNARMTARSYRRWRRNRGMARPLFGRFALVLAQNEALADNANLVTINNSAEQQWLGPSSAPARAIGSASTMPPSKANGSGRTATPPRSAIGPWASPTT